MTRTLISVLGGTPQVVTETLFGLLEEGSPLPDELMIITTAFGKKCAIDASLLDKECGPIAAFAREYDQLDWLARVNLVGPLVPELSGEDIWDIDSLACSEQMSNLIFREIGAACSKPESHVHVSIAGGRKTMSYLAGQALSIFGRRNQSRLTHVLLDPWFESHSEFYFPPKAPRTFHKLDRGTQKPISERSSADARVQLAEVWFPHISGLLTPQELASYERIQIQSSLDRTLAARISIGPLQRRTVRFGDRELTLSPRALAFLLMLCERHAFGQPQLDLQVVDSSDPRARELMWAQARVESQGLAQVGERTQGWSRLLRRFESAVGHQDNVLSECATQLKEELKKHVRLDDLTRYVEQSQGKIGICSEARVELAGADPNIRITGTDLPGILNTIREYFSEVPSAQQLCLQLERRFLSASK
jgi:CRISPR-associated protein (TIGR02584 family)